MDGRNRRRQYSEACPLEIDHHSYPDDYATFSSVSHTTEKTLQTTAPFWWVLLQFISPTRPSSRASFHSQRRERRDTSSCHRFSAAFVVALILVAYSLSREKRAHSLHTYSIQPEWDWDHNVYVNREQQQQQQQHLNAPNRSEHRNLLIVQTASNPIQNLLTDITSRPNRAYAEQWRRDYVRYDSSSNKSNNKGDRTCLDRVIVLQTILEEQLQQQKYGPSAWQQQEQYDVLAFLPPTAVIKDLDFDLLDLVPDNKLVAVPGSLPAEDDPRSFSTAARIDMVLINLRHADAATLTHAWLDAVRSSSARGMPCDAERDVSTLLYAIQSVLDPPKDLSSLVHSLSETEQGFVGNSDSEFVIKDVVPSTAADASGKAVSLLANLPEIAAGLQTTADSVCYRYFPKCEVV